MAADTHASYYVTIAALTALLIVPKHSMLLSEDNWVA